MSSPERRRRALHKLAVAAAALAVCVLPTACDYPIASPPGAPTTPGTDQPTTSAVVVPVGNTSETNATETESSDPTETETSDASETETSEPTDTTATEATDTTDTVAPTSEVPVDDTPPTSETATSAPPTSPPPVEQPVPLGRDCSNSGLPLHTGFQSPDAQCVTTAMGAVPPEANLPSLLITKSPRIVGVGRKFMLEISTRNLVRDRFLGAAAGGYYLESSFLTDPKDTRFGGLRLQRGHFHTACRMLASTREAPNSAPAPAFFLATQDNGGGTAPDKVTIEVPATATTTPGVMQCSSWAGDGSHRTPMMSRANQTPAFDSVRIRIFGRAAAEQPDVNAADAVKDAAQQKAAEQQQAGAQAPDQNGATQLGAAASDPAAGSGTAAPATGSTTGSAAATSAPATTKSLQERFKELRDKQAGGGS